MKLIVAAVLLVLCAYGCNGCKKNVKTKDDAAQTLKPCKKPGGGSGCNTYTCGGNSAITNAFPLNGWRPDGECNPDEIQLVPGSLTDACKDQTLDIDGSGKLIGRKSDGTPGCIETALKGSKFAVASYHATEWIEITDVIPDWTGPNPNDKRTAYRMEWVKETEVDDNGKRKGLCGKNGQKLRQVGLKIDPMDDSADLPKADPDLVIPVVSELYTEEGIPVPMDPSWPIQKVEWNHLACVDDALAKRTIFHLDAPDVSRAALRMWKADYCGGTSWTVRGEWIAWGHDIDDDKKVEAQWDENGATCLTAPRVLRDDNDQVIEPPNKTEHLLKRECQNKCNGANADWFGEMKTCHNPDGSAKPALPPCKVCSGSNCPLSSRNAAKPNP